jgi:ATP synthase protein I
MSEATESPTNGEAAATAQQNPHAESVRRLANAMLRTAVWPSAATVVLGAVVATVWVGASGLLGAVIGGAVAFASSLATIWLMRWTSAMPLMFVMVAALGGYVGKMIVLLVVMTLLRGIDVIHTEALAFTLLATVLVWAGAEVHAFRKTKIPTIVPGS